LIVEQAVAEHTAREETPAEIAQFDRTAQTGWNWFTKFLLWNVIACVVALLVIGLFTVWS
jgi:hypothetical protein